MVYIIQQGRCGPIKIGYTDNEIDGRLAQLQTGSPHKLHVILTLEGDTYLEKKLHDRFSKFRLEGEWFSPNLLSDLFLNNPYEGLSGDSRSKEELEDVKINMMGIRQLESEIKKTIRRLKESERPVIWPDLFEEDLQWVKANPESAIRCHGETERTMLIFKLRMLLGKENVESDPYSTL